MRQVVCNFVVLIKVCSSYPDQSEYHKPLTYICYDRIDHRDVHVCKYKQVYFCSTGNNSYDQKNKTVFLYFFKNGFLYKYMVTDQKKIKELDKAFANHRQ